MKETGVVRLHEVACGRLVLALILATAAVPTRATTAELSRGAKGAKAEIQIGLCSPTEQVVQRLDLRPRGASITVWQFDDPALTLFARGVRLRLRVAADGGSELTLKVANQDCARLEHGLVPVGEGKCEYDVYGTSMAGAVSLNRHLDAESTGGLVAGRVAPASVLSQSQTSYLRDVARIWPLPTQVHALGPMLVQTYRTPDKLYDIDISQLPGGIRYAEISRKVPVADALRLKRVMEADLSNAGVEACADQSSQAGNKLRSLLR
jgi:hypothetical protein